MARKREDFGQKRAAELKPLQLPIYAIETGGRRRPLNQKSLETITASLKEIGLQTPITVRRDEKGYHLVAGLHRFKAAEALGWYFIDAFMVEWDERRCRLWELAENLHRADLTELQRDEQLAEWMRLMEEDVQLAQVAPIESKRADKKGHRRDGGERAAARELGVDRDKARRAKKIDAIAPEAKQAAVSAGLDDNQTALLEVAKFAEEPADTQVAKVHEIAEERIKRKEKHSVESKEPDDVKRLKAEAKGLKEKEREARSIATAANNLVSELRKENRLLRETNDILKLEAENPQWTQPLDAAEHEENSVALDEGKEPTKQVIFGKVCELTGKPGTIRVDGKEVSVRSVHIKRAESTEPVVHKVYAPYGNERLNAPISAVCRGLAAEELSQLKQRDGYAPAILAKLADDLKSPSFIEEAREAVRSAVQTLVGQRYAELEKALSGPSRAP